MPAIEARLVSIITVTEARDRVTEGLEALGLRAFTTARVRGRGAHGRRMGGFFESENVEFTVITTEANAARVLAWVEEDLVKLHPSVAYSTPVSAVPGDHFR